MGERTTYAKRQGGRKSSEWALEGGPGRPFLLPGTSHGPRSLVGCGVVKSQTRLSNFTFTFHFHALEKEMATHSSTLAWRIPGMVEPGGLSSMGSHRVGHDWSNLAAAAAYPVLAPHQHSRGKCNPLTKTKTNTCKTRYCFVLMNKIYIHKIYSESKSCQDCVLGGGGGMPRVLLERGDVLLSEWCSKSWQKCRNSNFSKLTIFPKWKKTVCLSFGSGQKRLELKMEEGYFTAVKEKGGKKGEWGGYA